jgi:hypothetical protein
MEKTDVNNTTALAIVVIATVAVVLIGGLALVPALELQQEAEARPFGPGKSCDFGGRAFNASEGRCFHP